MASVDERENRRKNVAELSRTGAKPGEIAKKLGITPQLAGRDLSWVRKNKPEWLKEELEDKTPDSPVSKINDDVESSTLDDSTVVKTESSEGEPITEETPAVKVIQEEEQLLDPPAPPVQVESVRKPVDYTMDTILGRDDDVDDRPIDEIWMDKSEPSEYGQREKFMDMSDEDKWDYMQHKVTTDFVLIACVAIVIILILALLFSMR